MGHKKKQKKVEVEIKYTTTLKDLQSLQQIKPQRIAL